jgi:hypothetical protein
MSERARRLASNEALFRLVNDEIENLDPSLADARDGTLSIVCECGDLACSDQLVVPAEDYERIRADDTLFLVKPGHELAEVEDVVEKSEFHYVVRKRAPAVPIVSRDHP